MKVNLFIPSYMINFKCIGSECIDTCCAGWDINIDEDTYDRYINSTGELKTLVSGKFRENKNNDSYLNKGNMILKDINRCPFLNESLLCDIHGNIGEENLCITCKRYPRVYNIVDGIYELSGLPSCIEVCNLGFRNKEKIDFIECERDVDTESIEIRRIIDTEAFEGSDSILQYFWEIRVNSINIIQNRNVSIEERFKLLSAFYLGIEKAYSKFDFDEIEDLIDAVSEHDYSILERECFDVANNNFYTALANEELLENIKSIRLKAIVRKYKSSIETMDNISEFISENNKLNKKIKELDYIFENYIVSNIFRDLIPFNDGEKLMISLKNLINKYKVIKAYALGITIGQEENLTEEFLIEIIQSLSKDIEHNKVYKDILS